MSKEESLHNAFRKAFSAAGEWTNMAEWTKVYYSR